MSSSAPAGKHKPEVPDFGQQMMATGPITRYQAEVIRRNNAGLPPPPMTLLDKIDEWTLPVLGALLFIAFCLMVALGQAPWQ